MNSQETACIRPNRASALTLSLLWSVSLLISGCAVETAKQSPRSYFERPPVQLNPASQGLLKVTDDFSFIDETGKQWRAPAGIHTDGASIPSAFIPIIGDRLDPDYLQAAVVHDAFCGHENSHAASYHSEPWEHVHRMFYEATLAGGTNPLKAKVMYAAVYLGGPRWDDPARDISMVPKADLKQELKWCMQLIEDRNASTEQLEDWMRDREANLISGNIVAPDWAN